MKAIYLALLFTIPSFACDQAYIKIGSGYKFAEREIYFTKKDGTQYKFSDPISARFEVGMECGAITFGVSHHSQWATGKPFNNEDEPHKSEFFIDYKWEFNL